MSMYKKILILAFCVLGMSATASAQRDSSLDFAEQMHNKDKSGCQTRLAMQYTALDSYKRGIKAEELARIQAFVPIFEDMYENIRKDGEQKARLDMMSEYEKCVENAPANDNLSTEYDLIQKHGACAQLNGVITDTLNSIKARRSANSVVKKYERSAIDLSETSFSDIANPELLIIAQLYKMNRLKGYDAAVEGGNIILVSCAY